jgi:hypothetical protein
MPTITPTPVTPTVTPTPTPTVVVTVGPLSVGWSLESKWCLSEQRWMARFRITASGGDGQYTYYRDIEQIQGPTQSQVYIYELELGVSSAAVGTFFVESGGQRAEEKFWVANPDCTGPTPPPQPPQQPQPPLLSVAWELESTSCGTSGWVAVLRIIANGGDGQYKYYVDFGDQPTSIPGSTYTLPEQYSPTVSGTIVVESGSQREQVGFEISRPSQCAPPDSLFF